MASKKLSNTAVQSLKPNPEKTIFIWDGTAQGFGVRISPSGVKSYIAQARLKRKTRRVTIARTEQISCNDARRKASEIVYSMSRGIDHREKVREKSAVLVTLQEVVDDYLENNRTVHGELRERSKLNCVNNMRRVFPDWLSKPVTEITPDVCYKRFISYSDGAPAQANQAFRNLRAVLNYARERYRSSDGTYPILAINPVSQTFARGGRARWNRVKPRDSRIPLGQLGAVWSLLSDLSDAERNSRATSTAADIVRLSLLTGARKSEMCTLQWSDVDLLSPVPTICFKETKNHADLVLPMSELLVDILQSRLTRRENQYVFPSVRGSTPYMADARSVLTKILQLVGIHIHPHALRRTFDDVARAVGVDADERRLLLTHAASDVHSSAYSNNRDPSALIDAMERISNWY